MERTVVASHGSHMTAPISQAVRVGDLVFASGQVAMDPSTGRFTGVPIGEVDEATRALVAPLVERAGLVAAFNDAWLLIGGLVILSMLVFLVRAPTRSGSST